MINYIGIVNCLVSLREMTILSVGESIQSCICYLTLSNPEYFQYESIKIDDLLHAKLIFAFSLLHYL